MKKSISIYRIQLVRTGEVLLADRTIVRPRDVFEASRDFLLSQYGEMMPDREVCGVLWLNTKNIITAVEIISIGTLDASLVHPREVLKGGLLHNASSFILFHNHPSGDPTPSQEDIDITERLKQASEVMGIELMDHLVIGDHSKYYSLKEEGLI